MSDAQDQGHGNTGLPLTDCGKDAASAIGQPDAAGDVIPVATTPPDVTGEAVAPAPIAGSAPQPRPTDEAVSAALALLHEDVRALHGLLTAVQTRLANLEDAVGTTAKQIAFLPPQVRMLGGKIDGLATSISEPRYRAVLLSLLGVYDLVDQVLYTLPAASESTAEVDHRRHYEILRTQLRQILEMNGLSEITTDGGFDPTMHHALRRVPCTDPQQMDCVLEVVRPGFRTEQSILRYADVLVGQYVPQEPSARQDS